MMDAHGHCGERHRQKHGTKSPGGLDKQAPLPRPGNPSLFLDATHNDLATPTSTREQLRERTIKRTRWICRTAILAVAPGQAMIPSLLPSSLVALSLHNAQPKHGGKNTGTINISTV